MLWGSPTCRPNGSIKCRTTGTRTTSACTPISPPSVEPSWTWCTSSSGERSPWCTTTAQVQVQSAVCLHLPAALLSFSFSCSVWRCFKTFGPLHLYNVQKKRPEVLGELQKRLRGTEFRECFVTCRVNSEINSLLFCLSPAGAAHVGLPGEWAAGLEKKNK